MKTLYAVYSSLCRTVVVDAGTPARIAISFSFGFVELLFLKRANLLYVFDSKVPNP